MVYPNGEMIRRVVRVTDRTVFLVFPIARYHMLPCLQGHRPVISQPFDQIRTLREMFT